jgi:NitT/TauT family transport system permease protein
MKVRFPLDPLGLLSIALVLSLWQLAAWRYDSVLFPGPWTTAVTVFENFPVILAELGNTLRRALIAFGLSVLVMVPFGIACGRMRLLGMIVDPILEFLITIPPPAVIPVVMVLAGVGDVAKIAVISYAMIPNILINTIETVRQAPPMLDRVGRSLRLNRLESMVSIDLPAALPGIVTGLRLGVTAAMLVTITSEMLLSTNGLGAFVQRSQESLQVATGLAGVVAIAIMGLVINIGLRLVEERFLFWHYRVRISDVGGVDDASERTPLAARAATLGAWAVSRTRHLIPGRDSYRPERHYMRGPGPRARSKLTDSDNVSPGVANVPDEPRPRDR